MNYFELFDLPPAPSANSSLLTQKYFELQRKNHPDFFTQATDAEKEEALKQSADINRAFNVFQNKEKTIEYFLQTAGLIAQDEKYSLPADFLMEMMEINEALADEDALAISKRVADYEALIFSEVRPVIEFYDADKTSQADLLKLKDYYFKKKYLNRILDRLGD